MKTTQSLLILLCLLCFTPLFSQLTFGLKGGVNYDSFGTLEPLDLSLENFKADAQTGFHLGVLGT